jgi:hypothetical protein
MNKVVRNERRKLRATFLNSIGIAVMAAGAFSTVLNGTRAGSVSFNDWVTVAICVLLGASLHFAAVWSLRGLEE